MLIQEIKREVIEYAISLGPDAARFLQLFLDREWMMIYSEFPSFNEYWIPGFGE